MELIGFCLILGCVLVAATLVGVVVSKSVPAVRLICFIGSFLIFFNSALICGTVFMLHSAFDGEPDDLYLWLFIACVLIVSAAPLVAAVLKLRRLRREQDVNICRGCGYDLRGITAATTNCPECGTYIRPERRQEVSS